jgi:LysM domain
VKLRPGETLARLAKANKVPRERLRRINAVTDESEAVPGTTLLIPRAAKPAPKPKARS